MLNIIHHTKTGIYAYKIATISAAVAVAAHLGFMQALLDDPFGADEKEWDDYNQGIAELSKSSNIEKIELAKVYTIEIGG